MYIAAIILENDTILYVSNISPLLWTNKKEEAKIFDSEEETKNALELDTSYLYRIKNKTKIKGIFILNKDEKDIIHGKQFI